MLEEIGQPDEHAFVSIGGYTIGYVKEESPRADNPKHANYFLNMQTPNDRMKLHVPCTFDQILEISPNITNEILERVIGDNDYNYSVESNQRFRLYKIMDSVFKDTKDGHLLYERRSNRKVSAVEFFRREYCKEIESGTLTLTCLKRIDQSLWDMLRRPTYYESVADVLPRGENKGGRPIKQLGFDPSALDPENEQDALILSALRQREHARASMRRIRATRRSGLCR